MAIRNTIEIHYFSGKKKKKKSFFLRGDWWGQVRVFLDFAKKKKIVEIRVFSYFQGQMGHVMM
jgi:hypothetical protein